MLVDTLLMYGGLHQIILRLMFLKVYFHQHYSISMRISTQSSNCVLFSKAAPMCNAAIETAGYAEKINYDSKINENKPSDFKFHSWTVPQVAEV